MNFYDEIKAAYQERPQYPKDTFLSHDDRITLTSLIGYLKYSALRSSADGRTSFNVVLLTGNTDTILRYSDKYGQDCACNEGWSARLFQQKDVEIQRKIVTAIKQALGPGVIFHYESKSFLFDKKKKVLTLTVSWIHPELKTALSAGGHLHGRV